MSNGFFDQHSNWIPQAEPQVSQPDTIRIAGREYQVERDDSATHGPQYVLTGPRGARYRALRSLRQPGMLYLTNSRDWTMSAPKVWLTDKSGKLEVAR